MKGLIQRFPAALLPLLSIKASETPPQLDEVVQPSLEMLPSYAADRFEVQIASAAGVSTVSLAASISVPAGEYWLVGAVSTIGSNVTAGGLIQLAVAIVDPANVTVYIAADSDKHTATAGQTFVVPAQLAQPLLLRPGMSIRGGTLIPPTTGTVDIALRVLVARFSPQ